MRTVGQLFEMKISLALPFLMALMVYFQPITTFPERITSASFVLIPSYDWIFTIFIYYLYLFKYFYFLFLIFLIFDIDLISIRNYHRIQLNGIISSSISVKFLIKKNWKRVSDSLIIILLIWRLIKPYYFFSAQLNFRLFSVLDLEEKKLYALMDIAIIK